MSLICPKCQTENTDKATFCSNCGNDLSGVEQSIKKYDGIGGWLILVGIGIVLSPIWSLTTIKTFSDFKSNDRLLSLYPDAISYINQGLFIHYIQLAIAAIMIYLFFKHKKIFPKAFIGLLIFNIALVFIDASILTSIFSGDDEIKKQINSESIKDLLKTLFPALIWIPYMLISKRVKGTFIK